MTIYGSDSHDNQGGVRGLARRCIGILGGLGPEATADCYRIIAREYYNRYHDHNFPPVVIYSLVSQKFIDAQYRLPHEVLKGINLLKQAGAEFVILPCNAAHVVFKDVAPHAPIPWISIMDAVAEHILQTPVRCVGLIGTKYTMEGDFYPETLSKYGIDVITPEPIEQNTIHALIYQELAAFKFTSNFRKFLLQCIEGMAKRGAEGIILGCTELGYVIKQQHTDVPIFDALNLLARKALEYSLGPNPMQTRSHQGMFGKKGAL